MSIGKSAASKLEAALQESDFFVEQLVFCRKGIFHHLEQQESAGVVLLQFFGAVLNGKAFCISTELIEPILPGEESAVDRIRFAPRKHDILTGQCHDMPTQVVLATPQKLRETVAQGVYSVSCSRI